MRYQLSASVECDTRWRVTRFAFASLAFLTLFTFSSFAQPPDSQVLKDISWPGVVKKELRPGTIKKVWSDASSQYYWDRACVVWRNANFAEYPKALIEIGGFARYSYVTNTYQEFLTTYNTYTGIPAPNDEEIMAMMRANLQGVLGAYKFENIVGELHYLRFPENGGPLWDSPTHLTVPVETQYERKEGPTWTVVYTDRLLIHFYRDAINSPWKDNVISEEKESTRGERKEYNEWDLKKMPTLGSVAAEQQAQAAMNAGPTVEIPAFASDKEALAFTVQVFRSGDEARIRAYLMKMLTAFYFVEGSTTQLNNLGQQKVDAVIAVCCKSQMNWGEQYCASPAEHEHYGNEYAIWNKAKDMYSRIAFQQGGTTWKNGQQVGGRLMLADAKLNIHTDDQNIARLRSYEPGFLCKEEGGEGRP